MKGHSLATHLQNIFLFFSNFKISVENTSESAVGMNISILVTIVCCTQSKDFNRQKRTQRFCLLGFPCPSLFLFYASLGESRSKIFEKSLFWLKLHPNIVKIMSKSFMYSPNFEALNRPRDTCINTNENLLWLFNFQTLLSVSIIFLI